MTDVPPLELAMSDACEAILAASRAVRPLSAARPVVIGVTGAVAAGKSTLARRLSRCVVATDHYLPDYDRTPEHLRDLPESSDLARLADDLSELRAGRPARIPNWSFESHARTGERLVEPAELVVVEGLHALHELPRAHVDIAVFVECPRDERWTRAVAREAAGERPWGIEYLRHFFETVAEPTFAIHAGRYRASARFVVRSDARAE